MHDAQRGEGGQVFHPVRRAMGKIVRAFAWFDAASARGSSICAGVMIVGIGTVRKAARSWHGGALGGRRGGATSRASWDERIIGTRSRGIERPGA